MKKLHSVAIYNQAEIHLRDLPVNQVEVTYLGIKRIINSPQLWALVVDARRVYLEAEMKRYKELLK